MQRDLRMIEDEEQFGLVRVEAGEQAVERGKAGAPPEDAVEAGAQFGPAPRRRIGLIGLEITVEPPDEGADALLRRALPLGESLELVDEALGMHPAQAMPAERELSSVVADDGGRAQKTVRLDTAPQGAFGGDLHWVMTARDRADGEPGEMVLPSQAIGEPALGMVGEPGEQRPGEMLRAHVIERRSVDYVILMAGAQQFEPFDKLRSSAGSSKRWYRTRRNARCRSACRSRSAPCAAPWYHPP